MNALSRLRARSETFLKNKANKFHEAAERVQLLSSGQPYDDFAIDIYYHRSCYILYVHKNIGNNENATRQESHKCNDVLEDFSTTFE